jgi:hypothetical protein
MSSLILAFEVGKVKSKKAVIANGCCGQSRNLTFCDLRGVGVPLPVQWV